MPVLDLDVPNAPQRKSSGILGELRPDRREVLLQPALGLDQDQDLPGSVSGDMFQAQLPHSSFPFFGVNSHLSFSFALPFLCFGVYVMFLLSDEIEKAQYHTSRPCKKSTISLSFNHNALPPR